jgi:hypothetical protein
VEAPGITLAPFCLGHQTFIKPTLYIALRLRDNMRPISATTESTKIVMTHQTNLSSPPEVSLRLPDMERHVARLLIVMYHCGEPTNTLTEGQTWRIDSRGKLSRFDFWVREPGHLALALLDASQHKPSLIKDNALFKATLDRMLENDQADIRRVMLPGAPVKPQGIAGELNLLLSDLAARALISDRPSFNKSGGHQIVLENAGAELAKKIMVEAPSFVWYGAQCAAVKAFWPLLESYDLATMPYLGLSPLMVAVSPLIPVIKERYQRTS